LIGVQSAAESKNSSGQAGCAGTLRTREISPQSCAKRRHSIQQCRDRVSFDDGFERCSKAIGPHFDHAARNSLAPQIEILSLAESFLRGKFHLFPEVTDEVRRAARRGAGSR